VQGDKGVETLDGSIGEGQDEYHFYLITQVHSRNVRDFSPVLDRFGLTIALWRSLSTINRLGGCLMSELSEFTTVDRTTLTRTVDQLVDMNLVARCTTPDDRRLVRVELTEHGRAVFAASIERLGEHNEHILAGLSPEEMRTLRALLQRILRNIVKDDGLFRQVVNFSR
jgi:DNA-binding MarR family transcriptional regulator